MGGNRGGFMAHVKVGEKLHDFKLKNQNDLEVDTAGFKGKNILLSFHPLAWTAVCAKQMRSLEDNFDAFEKLNTVPLGISIDTAASKKAWAESLGIKKLDLLSDFWPHGGTASKLGIFLEQFGFSERANIILDGERKAIFVKVYPIKQLPDVNELLEFLKKNNKE
jgi:peroxiredoxin